jgi:DNA-binding NarL/FixJ family response regulator
MTTRRNLPRILIADDHTLVAEAFKNLLNTDYEVVGTVGDGRSLVRATAELSPDLIVLDVDIPILKGLDAGEQIKELLPDVKLLYVATHLDAELAAEAFRRGASGYLVKACGASELVIAVREVLQGRSYVSPGGINTCDVLLREGRALLDGENRLTERQRQVLRLIAEGKRMKEVGSVLSLTARTVAFHKYRIMEKLNANSDAELVQYAVKHHLIAA